MKLIRTGLQLIPWALLILAFSAYFTTRPITRDAERTSTEVLQTGSTRTLPS